MRSKPQMTLADVFRMVEAARKAAATHNLEGTIAIVDFGGEAELGQKITAIITNNLKRCGYFAPIDQAAFIEKAMNFDAAPQFAPILSIQYCTATDGQDMRTGSREVRDHRGLNLAELRFALIFKNIADRAVAPFDLGVCINESYVKQPRKPPAGRCFPSSHKAGQG